MRLVRRETASSWGSLNRCSGVCVCAVVCNILPLVRHTQRTLWQSINFDPSPIIMDCSCNKLNPGDTSDIYLFSGNKPFPSQKKDIAMCKSMENDIFTQI